MKDITMLYLHDDTAEFQKIAPELDTYYELIKCSCIDIVRATFNGKDYDVICDDEALLKSGPYSWSVVSPDGFPLIAGNILICNMQDGIETALTPEDIARLLPAVCYTVQNKKLVASIVAD